MSSLSERLLSLARAVGDDIKNIFTALTSLGERVTEVESRLETGILTKDGSVTNPKMFSTIVEASGGQWTVDYSSAGFTSILSVHATAEDVGTDAGDRRIACITNGSISTTGCSGRLMSANSAGLLAVMTLTSGDSGRVHVLVIGT